MPKLNHAITAALRELEQGLAVQREQGKLALVPERVQLTLAFALDEDGTVNAAPDGPHSMTIEFKSGSPTALAAASTAPRPVTVAEGEVFPALSQLFGAPGFDSSARATVFRDALEGMSQEQILTVLAAASAAPAAGTDAATRMAAHLLRGVIQSGPTKAVDRGVNALRELLARHPLAELLRVAEAEWKTQAAWL
ncbi:MAG: hypothetical protein HZA92_11365 [Verrucomicrobia bacterium]|nr:hypothetical protein [Verrucomicrobiota bacterium]